MTQITAAAYSLAERFVAVRSMTEVLAGPLSAEDQTVQSMPDVSPTKWHRGHTSWFIETFLLQPNLAGYDPFHPAFAYIFNSYYEAVGARHPRAERGVISRPGIEEVGAYRHYVDQAMGALLDGLADEAALSLVELGLHHEQQHQELLLMDIKHVLSQNPLRPAYLPAPTRPAPTEAERRDGRRAPNGTGPTFHERGPLTELAPMGWTGHAGGKAEIGMAGGTTGLGAVGGTTELDTAGSGFAFDNEYPRHAVQLTPFALAERPVTCGDWMAFIADGGYHRPDLWLSDGWAMVMTQGWEAPLYWSAEPGTGSGTGTAAGAQRHGDHRWSVFTLTGERAIDPAEPVCHVSYYEADAFAHWTGCRLPTESEWETVAAQWPVEGDFLDLTNPAEPSAMHPRAPSVGGGLYGGVWDWTQSAYSPYPGFRAAPGAVGEYNGKFMVNQYVLRGGSCVTPLGHTRPTYRNFFPASARWAFSGLRLARDL